MEDDFKTINKDVWGYEIQRGGFGSGTFEWTTDDPKNAYTDAEGLHIVPTLTTESTDITAAQLIDNYVLNLTVGMSFLVLIASADMSISRRMEHAQQRASKTAPFGPTRLLVPSSTLFAALDSQPRVRRRSGSAKSKSLPKCLRAIGYGLLYG